MTDSLRLRTVAYTVPLSIFEINYSCNATTRTISWSWVELLVCGNKKYSNVLVAIVLWGNNSPLKYRIATKHVCLLEVTPRALNHKELHIT